MTETALRDLAQDRADRLDEAGTAWSGTIAKSPASAKLTFKITGEGTGPVATRITAGKHEFSVDEPAALAGEDTAASPVEYALGALISCQVVVYRLYAHQLGIRFDGIDIGAEGDLDVRGLFGADETVRPGFSEVRLTVSITGPESQKRYEELGRTVEARCPVQDIFANHTPVTARVVKR
ncbi:OsmC family protein [Kocuria sp. cx-455]|uniref:OsmC family protein n=1 Tax=Kocuria sp. cx-455 TaxID=2771377 RepID=UPI003D742F2F